MKRILVAAAFACAVAGTAHAQQTLRVIDTAPNDVLNVRGYPTTNARIVVVIPPDGRGIVATGMRNGNWLFVRYANVEGWTSRRFIYPEMSTIKRGRRMHIDNPQYA